MAWQWGSFRGKRVLVRVSSRGSVAESDGRVDIRFRLGDAKTYPASVRNVFLEQGELVEDDTPPPREDPKQSPKLVKPWIAYTDGACTGNPGPAGAGLVLMDASGKLVKEAYRFLGQATNNVAELTAISMVYDHLPNDASVMVHTDSKYAIGVLTQGWKAKANSALIAAVKERIARSPTQLKYVPGHSGIVLNERADELAREAIAMRRSSE